MDDYGMHDVRNYQKTPLIRFVIKIVLYVFYCVQKENGLLWCVLWVIDGCYLSLSLFACMFPSFNIF